jgi:hypothetical protein
MPDKTPRRFRRVLHLEEIVPLVDEPYNKPSFDDAHAKEDFRKEYEQADAHVRSALQSFGEIDAFGHKEFSMGNPWNSSRKIGVTLNAESLFDRVLVTSLQAAVGQMPADYLIVLSGEYEAGGGTFYICIRKDGDILGYAPDKEMLAPFGFE